MVKPAETAKTGTIRIARRRESPTAPASQRAGTSNAQYGKVNSKTWRPDIGAEPETSPKATPEFSRAKTAGIPQAARPSAANPVTARLFKQRVYQLRGPAVAAATPR